MELREWLTGAVTYRNQLIDMAKKVLTAQGIEQTDENISMVCNILHADICQRVEKATEVFFLMGASEKDPNFIQGLNEIKRK